MKTALFDLDGVLIDSMPLIQKAFAYMVKKYGFDETRMHDRARWRGYTLRQCYSVLCGHEDVTPLCDEHASFQDKNPELITPFHGACGILESLRSNDFKIGVITNRSRNARSMLIHCQLMSQVDYVVAVEDVTNPKPHPEGIFKALNHFSRKPEHAYMIGDMPVDIHTGKNAGVRTIAINTSDCLEDLQRVRPDHIVRRLEELLPILTG